MLIICKECERPLAFVPDPNLRDTLNTCPKPFYCGYCAEVWLQEQTLGKSELSFRNRQDSLHIGKLRWPGSNLKAIREHENVMRVLEYYNLWKPAILPEQERPENRRR